MNKRLLANVLLSPPRESHLNGKGVLKSQPHIQEED